MSVLAKGKAGKRRPVILGYDAVSPLGLDLTEQWEQASAGCSGIGPLTRFPLREGFPVRIAGEVGAIDTGAYPFLVSRDMSQWTSPLFPYAMLVVHRALQMSGIEITPSIAPRTAITFSSAIGGLDAVLKADRRLVSDGRLPHPFTNPNACINMVGGKISIMTGATGPITATITACATGCTSMIMGALLIAQGMADIAICGAVDFPLVEPIVAGFATMNGAYRPKEGAPEEAPEGASRPFSRNRRGFVVSEGAGCIIMAAPDFAEVYGLQPLLEMAGWAMTSDAHHFVAPNLETVRRCIADSLSDAGLQAEDIDAINAHGTSTKVGDRVEWRALRDVFGPDIPPVTANKSQTGHAMGASSAIETILAMESMRNGQILPTINYQADLELPIDCVTQGTRNLEQEYVLKNAFGFGGCNNCLILHRIV
ncbi:MAG: beta-ketoacyl-[acyl-carrier-protein] synthase family protein [Deltaproteobacteria bacterium]|jgi:3-oxoacyl-[acyl-carrier-protein] synthase II|nr:beta-ketoacyl-[acyl-carrier-protein] synthase family protein [Deltaproteobacteria bacterium]